MKQTILKKLLVSGAAAIGIMGLSTPAAFAGSNNSGYGNSHNNYSSYNERSNYSPCHREKSNYGSNMYGGRNMRPSYGNMNRNRNNMSSSSSFAVAFAFAASGSTSSSSNNNRW